VNTTASSSYYSKATFRALFDGYIGVTVSLKNNASQAKGWAQLSNKTTGDSIATDAITGSTYTTVQINGLWVNRGDKISLELKASSSYTVYCNLATLNYDIIESDASFVPNIKME